MARKRKQPAAPKPPKAGSLDYYPAIGPFWPDQDGCPPNTFILRHDDSRHEAILATVTINPMFNHRTVERFMWMFVQGPSLWKALYDLLKSMEGMDNMPQSLDAMKALWEAAMFNPIASNDPFALYSNDDAISLLQPEGNKQP